MMWHVLPLGLFLLGRLTSAAAPYGEYILAPTSRTIYPASIYSVNGTVSDAQSLIDSPSDATALLRGNSTITFDYGKNIAGLVSITVGTSSSPDAVLALTFTESNLWINGQASDGTADAGLDTPLYLSVGAGPGTYTVGDEFERGAFRYLSVVSNSTGTVEVKSVVVDYRAAPTQDDLTSYTGYFHSNDELLNRIWYAGAYTCQICSIDPAHGDSLVWLRVINSTQVIELPETVAWWSNYTITGGKTALVDGAKRDRLVWPGDLVVAAPTIFVSTGDMDSIRNALDSLLSLQNSTGALPYAGSPFIQVTKSYSFTYHLHNLLDIALYYEYKNDLTYLQSVWGNFTLGLSFTLGYVDATGLLNVTTPSDWLRIGMGGHNVEANAILHYTLNKGIGLANILNDTGSASKWASYASGIKSAANELLWDNSTSLYRDNETTTLHPQDGNAWAIVSNLTLSTPQSLAVSDALKSRWGPYGAPAPEAGGSPETVSPFIGYFELMAHYMAGNASASHELMRTEWGFMLDDPRMTNSTFIEGYSADGSLHYAPYTNDARVSHAHGWSAGPTSLLTLYTAGLRIESAGGATWAIAPRLGGLSTVEAGYTEPLGAFSVSVGGDSASGAITALNFTTPAGTTGTVDLGSGVTGSLQDATGNVVALSNGRATEVKGGSWKLVTSGQFVTSSGSSAAENTWALLLSLVATLFFMILA
ncbi:hypothetical protein DHEL01_v206966 [Diaporthe helianthi]|uniref:Alpha-L-rhamnosidase six-hairpin glycosidase domain-containing protein n=1 Tax=Diaporthe helianthi TaxID=158607 RepID=A0A2P5HWK3_DIAHE|nr:hypothetical protein DHEL01_v206966 [Diaporthe helianthi]